MGFGSGGIGRRRRFAGAACASGGRLSRRKRGKHSAHVPERLGYAWDGVRRLLLVLKPDLVPEADLDQGRQDGPDIQPPEPQADGLVHLVACSRERVLYVDVVQAAAALQDRLDRIGPGPGRVANVNAEAQALVIGLHGVPDVERRREHLVLRAVVVERELHVVFPDESLGEEERVPVGRLLVARRHRRQPRGGPAFERPAHVSLPTGQRHHARARDRDPRVPELLGRVPAHVRGAEQDRHVHPEHRYGLDLQGLHRGDGSVGRQLPQRIAREPQVEARPGGRPGGRVPAALGPETPCGRNHRQEEPRPGGPCDGFTPGGEFLLHGFGINARGVQWRSRGGSALYGPDASHNAALPGRCPEREGLRGRPDAAVSAGCLPRAPSAWPRCWRRALHQASPWAAPAAAASTRWARARCSPTAQASWRSSTTTTRTRTAIGAGARRPPPRTTGTRTQGPAGSRSGTRTCSAAPGESGSSCPMRGGTSRRPAAPPGTRSSRWISAAPATSGSRASTPGFHRTCPAASRSASSCRRAAPGTTTRTGTSTATARSAAGAPTSCWAATAASTWRPTTAGPGSCRGCWGARCSTRAGTGPGRKCTRAAGFTQTGGWAVGPALVPPMAQAKVSIRASDTGANASNPVASGFERLILSPGIEVNMHPFTVYSDVELPVYQRFTGNQLAASVLFRLEVGYMF